MLEFHETAFMAYHGIIPSHLLLAAAMLLGVLFSGPFRGGCNMRGPCSCSLEPSRH